MSKLILSIDGGGIRGGASIHFLWRIEQALALRNLGSLRDYVDLYAGTSTGALIALGLSNTDVELDHISDMFGAAQSKRIYSHHFFGHVTRGLFSPRFKHQPKTAVLEKFFGDTPLSETRCKGHAIVLAYDLSLRRAAVFKTYHRHASFLRCADVVDASSATPTFFASKAVQIASHMPKHWFVDGSLVANNPALCALAEAKVIWPDEVNALRVLSIGSGLATSPIDAPKSHHWGSAQWLSRGNLIELLSDENTVNFQAQQLVERGCYMRVNSVIQSQPGLRHPPKADMHTCSELNIERVMHMGDFWYDRYGEAVIDFIVGRYQGPSLSRIDPAMGLPRIATNG